MLCSFHQDDAFYRSLLKAVADAAASEKAEAPNSGDPGTGDAVTTSRAGWLRRVLRPARRGTSKPR
jgi:hypothetical protein